MIQYNPNKQYSNASVKHAILDWFAHQDHYLGCVSYLAVHLRVRLVAISDATFVH